MVIVMDEIPDCTDKDFLQTADRTPYRGIFAFHYEYYHSLQYALNRILDSS